MDRGSFVPRPMVRQVCWYGNCRLQISLSSPHFVFPIFFHELCTGVTKTSFNWNSKQKYPLGIPSLTIWIGGLSSAKNLFSFGSGVPEIFSSNIAFYLVVCVIWSKTLNTFFCTHHEHHFRNKRRSATRCQVTLRSAYLWLFVAAPMPGPTWLGLPMWPSAIRTLHPRPSIRLKAVVSLTLIGVLIRPWLMWPLRGQPLLAPPASLGTVILQKITSRLICLIY